MDVFLATVPRKKKGPPRVITRVLREISPKHQYTSSTSEIFHLWADGRGESIHLVEGELEIWFDGYVRFPDVDSLPQAVRTLARRIVLKNVILQNNESGIFNILIWDRKSKKLYLTNDPGGLFPAYYAKFDDEILVCTHLYLLAKAINASPDYLQLAFKELLGHAIGVHTYFSGIKILAPGELLIFDIRNRSVKRNYPESYYTCVQEYGSDVVDVVFQALQRPIGRSAASTDAIGVMLSEGFDSRLVAEMFRQQGAKVVSFTHGTGGTLGERITQRVAESLDLEHHFEEAVFPSSQNALRRQLFLSDNLHIPYWESGSRFFSNLGVAAVVAGTALDSTLGGHIFYKPSKARLSAVWQRYSEIMRQNFGLISERYVDELSKIFIEQIFCIDLHRLDRRIRERFVDDVSEKIIDQFGRMKACLADEMERLKSSGSESPQLRLQRFFLEHRARRFSFGQELTLRVRNKVVAPTYERVFMKTMSAVPAREKLHHGLYFRLLRKHGSAATALPSGNYPLPATYPRIALETSRFVGKVVDLRTVRRYLSCAGKTDRLGTRSALFQDKNGRDPKIYRFFSEIFDRNQTVLRKDFYQGYLDRVFDFQARAFNLEDFYRTIENSQVIQHSF